MASEAGRVLLVRDPVRTIEGSGCFATADRANQIMVGSKYEATRLGES